ncbi:MAG: class I SAM-dependent methyltransferase [Anaerolineales bacterium]|nr:class I SAM-dependent methyltransferase [Anaerolineales bacterium]
MPEKDFLFLHLRDLPYFRALLRSVEAAFYQTLDLPAPTLDLGCGDGHFASLTFDRRLDVGLDPSPASLGEARARAAYRLLVQADGAGMPFPDGTFASAVSNSVLEHIPHLDLVLAETARVLRPGALLAFCVPNPRYFSELSLPRWLGARYTEWFRRISRVHHADGPEAWQERLEQAGLRLEKYWHYFSPAALRVLEWGHYLGTPALLVRKVTGRWLLAPSRWNLWPVERLLRRYAQARPDRDGTFTFYLARKT